MTKRLHVLATMLLLLVLVAACSSDGGGSGADATADFDRSVDIGGRNVYLTCHGQAAAAGGSPVFPALATSHRVCAPMCPPAERGWCWGEAQGGLAAAVRVQHRA